MLLYDSGGALRMWSMCLSFCLSAVRVSCLMNMLISILYGNCQIPSEWQRGETHES